MHEVLHLAHVPGDEQEQRGQRGHRAGSRGAAPGAAPRQHDERVDDRGDRRARRRSGCWWRCARWRRSRRCRRRTARRGCRSPGASSSRVGIVLGAGHAVGDHRREQRLDGAEHGDGEGAGQQLAQHGRTTRPSGARPGPAGSRAARQRRQRGMPARITPPTVVRKRVPMVATVEPRQPARRARARPAPPAASATSGAGIRRGQPRPERAAAPAWRAPMRSSPGASVGARPRQRRDPLEVVLGRCAELQPEEVLELQRGDDHRDAGGEAGGHRVGDELDQPPRRGSPWR